MDVVRRIDRGIVRRIRSRKLLDSVRFSDRRDLVDIQRKGKSDRTGSDDNFQHSVRHNIVHIRVLRRNDHLSRDDDADGDICADLMAEKSV